METITYHKATLADIQTVIDYRVKFINDFVGEQPLNLIEELNKGFKKYLEDALINDKFIVYIAKQKETIAGIGGMVIREQPGSIKNPSGRWAYFMNMYTVPEFRRKGICSGILNKLVEYGSNMGITAFELHATQEGEFVYKQNGFEIHNEPTYRKFIKTK